MTDINHSLPVVAAIDGSDTAIHAAQWATDEAISRKVPLRLVCVMKAEHSSADDYYDDLHHAEASLLAAQDAIEASGRPVKVETAIVSGLAGVSLVSESQDAALVCVGSVGIGRYARALLGSTATELAEKAHCPVAIIRPPDELPGHAVNWMIVAATDDPDNKSVVECAMEEAQLRHAPILVVGKRADLDHEVEQWNRRYPGVHAYPIADSGDVAKFLKHHDERIQLAVIGSSDVNEVAQILGPHGHPRFHRTAASVLVVRP